VSSLASCCPHLRQLQLRISFLGALAPPDAAGGRAGARDCQPSPEDCRLVTAALLQQLSQLTALSSLSLTSRHRCAFRLPLGGLAPLSRLRRLELGVPHDPGELQPLCRSLTLLRSLSLGGQLHHGPAASGAAGGRAADAAAAVRAGGRRRPHPAAAGQLALPAHWLPHTEYAVRHLENLTFLSRHLAQLSLTAQPAVGAALPLLAQLQGLTCLQLLPPAAQPHLSVRGMQPAHLRQLGVLQQLRRLVLPLLCPGGGASLAPSTQNMTPSMDDWRAALGEGLGRLVGLRSLRLIAGWVPCQLDLCVLQPLLRSRGRQLASLELQLQGQWGRAPAGGPAAGPGDLGFLEGVPELMLLLAGDAGSLMPVGPYFALPNLRCGAGTLGSPRAGRTSCCVLWGQAVLHWKQAVRCGRVRLVQRRVRGGAEGSMRAARMVGSPAPRPPQARGAGKMQHADARTCGAPVRGTHQLDSPAFPGAVP
jgi:hypothetical protein